MQIVFNGDKFHEMSYPVFYRKIRKTINVSSTELAQSVGGA